MGVDVKICGINNPEALQAAVTGGAKWVGFVFYQKSPRYITPEATKALASSLPDHIGRVGLVVNPDISQLPDMCRRSGINWLQLHGQETPEQIRDISHATGLPIIKALGIAHSEDLLHIPLYENIVDIILLDAKPEREASRPGGVGKSFDWEILQSFSCSTPWMLAGGINSNNIAMAIKKTGAKMVDISSGVESAPGKKSAALISNFLKKCRDL